MFMRLEMGIIPSPPFLFAMNPRPISLRLCLPPIPALRPPQQPTDFVALLGRRKEPLLVLLLFHPFLGEMSDRTVSEFARIRRLLSSCNR